MYSSGWGSSLVFSLFIHLSVCLVPSSSHHAKMLPGPALVVMATWKGGHCNVTRFSWVLVGQVQGGGRRQTPTSSQIGGILGEAACKHTDTKDVILRWSYPEVQQRRTDLEPCWCLARRDGDASSGLSLSSHLQTARVQHAEITRSTRVVKTADPAHIHLCRFLFIETKQKLLLFISRDGKNHDESTGKTIQLLVTEAYTSQRETGDV